ncbi:hypothetical protein IKF85_00230 [Candidatus Saccharibacteria bacterium]|nr:hypothetical protein [Candidatus Saccharibacteria bacterium]
MKKAKKSVKRYLREVSKAALSVFLIIWVLTFIAFINTLIIQDWMKIGLAFSALIIYFFPDLISYKFDLRLPASLKITFYLFVFAALVLGEVFAFYGPFPFWDIILHFLSGFVLAGIGLSLIEIMNKEKCKKGFTLLFAFCFSVTLGILWECLEFGFDMTLRTDAQKDAHVNNISTITMQRDGGNQPVKVNDIVNTDIHLASGETIRVDEGYLDIGLMDTMKDIFVNIAGATVFCSFGAAYLRKRNNNDFMKNFVPTKK